MNILWYLLLIFQKHRSLLFFLLLVIPFTMVFYQYRLDKLSKWIKNSLLMCYVAIILHYTVTNREQGHQLINLQPFWSYALWRDYQYRWQIIMNICLFIPFGFLIPYCTKKGVGITSFAGFMLAVAIEASQYYYGLGCCEFDDVFNNTVGTLMGFVYWKILVWGEQRCGDQTRQYFHDKFKMIHKYFIKKN